MNYLVIERKELYDLVWSKPITKIAVDYGISDSMVIKICKKLGVLRPGLGHWAKVAAGKKVRQLPLGKLPKDCHEKYHLSPHVRNNKQHASTQYEPPHPLVELELSEELKVTVVDDLENPHALVARNIKSFNNAKATDKLTLKPRAKSYFDIHVTEGTKERALRIMDALMHAFDMRGWAFNLFSDSDVEMAEKEFENAQAILVDTYKKGVAGGTGELFDWTLLPIEHNKPLILAGGLTPDNIRKAIQALQPYAVDVSGGVELKKSIKDHEKVTQFIKEVSRACEDK